LLLKTIFIMINYPNAKINIGLNIESKRSDGYHNISSVFYPIHNCYDILEIIESSEFKFTSSGITIPKGINLCEKAFNIIQLKYAINPVHIHLHKNIPIGAGLGGGSSDAAFTLKSLNEIFHLNISNDELEKLAISLGADCPFFIENRPKIINGIGDVMKNIDLDLSNYKIILMNSDIHISTKEAYNNVSVYSSEVSIEDLIFHPINSWKKTIKNDFEQKLFLKYPVLAETKKNLYSNGAVYASMTGSGSVIYGMFSSK